IHRQALHSFRLAFRHPITKADMDFTAPIPDDMQAMLKKVSP
ncbi:MAG: RluA family pseudouridine synthase, partial [Clostridiales bacterium]|nr:RluA family pseudouridine synthase [Clostridiales bacterium]